MGQGVLEEAPVAEAVAEADLEGRKLLGQRHDDTHADALAVALDDPDRLVGVFVTHGHAGLAHRRQKTGLDAE